MFELRYKYVERVAVDVFNVNEQGLGGFRARIRRLHDVGLSPDRPGTGTLITYPPKHALVLVVALVLEDLGQPPKTAATLARTIVGQYDENDRSHYVLLRPSMGSRVPRFSSFTTYANEKDFFDALRGGGREYAKAPPAYLVLDVKFYDAAVKEALRRIGSTEGTA
jgi:hypothetical protein